MYYSSRRHSFIVSFNLSKFFYYRQKETFNLKDTFMLEKYYCLKYTQIDIHLEKKHFKNLDWFIRVNISSASEIWTKLWISKKSWDFFKGF